MRARDLKQLALYSPNDSTNPAVSFIEIRTQVNCLLLILQALEGEPQPEPSNITAFRQWAEDVLETLTVLGYGLAAKKHRERLADLPMNVVKG